MSRRLALGILSFWIVGSAVSARGASLTLTSDQATYAVGETVVLTVTGFSEGAEAFGLFARVDYNPLLLEWQSGSQIVHTTRNGMMSWIGGGSVMANAGDGRAFLLDQLAPTVPSAPSSTDPTPTIGTATLIAEALGIVSVTFFVQPLNTLTLNYFGLTVAPGITFLITPIPEPASAALLVLGLAALAAHGAVRRRSFRSEGA